MGQIDFAGIAAVIAALTGLIAAISSLLNGAQNE